MFLLHINKYNLKKKNLSKIYYYKYLIEKMKKLKLTENSLNENNFVNFVIGISINRTKIILYLTDVKGKVIYFNTSGLLNLTKKQKRKKIVVIFKLLKILLFKYKNLTNSKAIALHFKNLDKRIVLNILFFIRKYLKNIKIIKITNNQPHNGCRPKKIKRNKKRKIKFLKN